MEYPGKVYLLYTWDEFDDDFTRFPLGVAYSEERARAVAEIRGRQIVAERFQTDDQPAVLEWQESNVDGETHLLEMTTGLSIVYYRDLVAFVDVEAEVTG